MAAFPRVSIRVIAPGNNEMGRIDEKNRAGLNSRPARVRERYSELLLPDHGLVDEDVVQDHHAAAGIRTLVDDQLNGLHCGS